MGELVTFMELARALAANPNPPRPTLYVVQQSPTGTHDFPPLADIDITGGLDGMRLWINGHPVFEGTPTSALRLKSAAEVFQAYGLLHLFRTPQEVVRAQLAASLPGPEDAA